MTRLRAKKAKRMGNKMGTPSENRFSPEVVEYANRRGYDRVEQAVDFMLVELRKARRTAVVMACLFGATFLAGLLTAVWLW